MKKKYAGPFLGELLRLGVKLANDCLDSIRDPDLREIIRAVVMSAAAGAALGAILGSLLGNTKAGAMVGAAVGVAAAIFATIVVELREENGTAGAELIVEAVA